MSIIIRLLKIATISLVAVSVTACARSDESDVLRKLSVLAEQGSAKAQYNLGMFYNNGIGTAKDSRRAFELFVQSASSGDPLASYKVGCYYAGQFPGTVTVDEEKALAAKLVAARAGYVLAQHDVGMMYASKENLEEAVAWWSAAAAQGDLASLSALSEVYRKGLGVQKDGAKALEFVLIVGRIIPDRQRAEVQAVAESLQKEVGPQGVGQAQRAAMAWAPKATELTIRAGLGISEAEQLVQ